MYAAASKKSILVAILVGGMLCLSAVRPALASGTGVWTGGGPKAKSVFALAIDSSNPNILYAGAYGSGVFKSTNAGAIWDPSTAGLTNTYIHAVAIYPQNHTILFAGTNDGIFKSTDSGITWVASLLTTHSARAICFDAGNPNLIYAGTLGDGIYKSTNLGASWQSAGVGLANSSVRTIAHHPILSGTALAGAGTGGGVHVTSSEGLFWSQVADTNGQGAVSDLIYDPLDASRVYAGMMDRGVLRSNDGGSNWTKINLGLTSFRTRALAVADTHRYVGTDTSGIFYTTLNSLSWQPRITGLPNLMIRALTTKPGVPKTVYAGTDGAGIYQSTNSGVSWTPLNTYLTDTTGRSLLVRNDPGGTLVCGTGFGDGIWRSTNDGISWIRAAVFDTRNSVLALEETGGGELYAAAYGNGVYSSLDGGSNWAITDTVTLANLFVRCLSADPTDAMEILVGTGDGPWRTTDAGASWAPLNFGFPPATSVRDLERAPGTPITIYAGTDSIGVYKSTDGGASWVASNSGLTQLYARSLAIDPTNAALLLLGTETGLFRSTNAGASWASYGSGLPSLPSIRALVVDPTTPTRVFAGIWEQGVYRSENGGASWTAMNGGLPDLKVYSLALNASRTTLFAGTRLRGVFAFTYSATGVGDLRDGAREGLTLTASPNPTSSAASLRFSISEDGPATIAIYGVQGALVRAFEGGALGRGAHGIVWDGRDAAGRPAASGVYFARLDAAGVSRSVKLTLMR